MVYATWKEELEAFEMDCDRLRKARRESFPVKVLGLAPVTSVPFMGGMGLGSRLLAVSGILVSGLSLLLELDKQREVYGGNLAIDLNPNSDYDNLAGAFRTRSPRWEALALLYSQLDPMHLKDRLSHLPDLDAGKALNRMIRRIQRGLGEVRDISPTTPGYGDIVLELAGEWREEVTRILDRALFRAGVVDAEDLEDLEGEDGEAIAPVAPNGNKAPTVQASAAAPPCSAQWSGQQWQLWQKLIADCPALRFPLMAKLVVISGPQQTGKSSLAAAIAYLRSYLLGWPSVAVTPHPDGNAIFPGVVVGAGRDFDAIQVFYTDMVDGFSMGGDRQSLIVDELTQYAGEWEELGQSLVRTALSESDKHGISPILINHAQTVSAGFAGIKGVKVLIDSSATQLLRQYGETAWGEQTRSAEIKMSRPGGGEVVFVLPDWLHLPQLQKQYPMAQTPVQSGPQGPKSMDAWVDDAEDFDGEWEAFTPPSMPLLTGWEASPAAARLWAWLARKQQATGKTAFTLTELAQGKPLGKNASHTADVLQPLIGELLRGGVVSVDGDRAIVLNL